MKVVISLSFQRMIILVVSQIEYSVDNYIQLRFRHISYLPPIFNKGALQTVIYVSLSFHFVDQIDLRLFR